MTDRVIVYVDGFNFYRGLREKKWRHYYWLDFVKFFDRFMQPGQELKRVNYFSAYPITQHFQNAEKKARQADLFSANMENPRFSLHLGKFLKKRIYCPACHAKNLSFEEKQTDVRIATQIISDCVYDQFDTMILVSADSDMVPPVEFVKRKYPDKKVGVFFPPKRFANQLRDLSHFYKHLENFEARFRQSLLPETVVLENGHELKMPTKWAA